jgi:hypothetical protein
MMIRENIRRKTAHDQRNGMVMVTAGGRKALGSLKNNVMEGKNILKVKVYRGYLNFLNAMELGNDARMTFLSNFSMQWELMISKEPDIMT